GPALGHGLNQRLADCGLPFIGKSRGDADDLVGRSVIAEVACELDRAKALGKTREGRIDRVSADAVGGSQQTVAMRLRVIGTEFGVSQRQTRSRGADR